MDVSALSTLRHEIQQLQQRARRTKEIAQWFYKHAALLRDVCRELDHSHYGDAFKNAAEVHILHIDEIDYILHDYAGKQTLDRFSQAFYVDVRWQWQTDVTINLPLLFAKVPEMGLVVSKQLRPNSPGQFNDGNLILLPSRWPMAASAMVYHISHERPETYAVVLDVLQHLFPASNPDVVKSLYAADLFDTQEALYDWLMHNEAQAARSPTPTSVLPDDLLT